MTTIYARASAVWASAAWNTQADGGGTPQSPVGGDTCEANGFTVDCADVDTSVFTLTKVSGGAYTSSRWYAQADLAWASAGWTCNAAGTGFSDTPAGTCTCDPNGHAVIANGVDVTTFTLYEGEGRFILTVGFAKTNGDLHTVYYNGRADGTGIDTVSDGITGTLDANTHHLTGSIADAAGWTWAATGGGSLTFGTTAAVYPAAGKVTDDVTAYGPTGAEYAGTYHEATVAEVKDGVMFGAASALEGEYSPGGTYAEGEAAQLATDQAAVDAVKAGIRTTVTVLSVTGTLDLDLYTLISGVAAATDVRDGTARYSGGGNGTLDLPAVGDVRKGTKYDNETLEGELITHTEHVYVHFGA